MTRAKYTPTGRWAFERAKGYRRRRGVLPGPSRPARQVKRVILDLSEHTVRELLTCIAVSERTDHLTRVAKKMLVEALVREGLKP